MTSYYDELAASTDPARRVGWKRRIGQAYRFELALQLARHADRVVDIGCGEAALAGYARERLGRVDYIGIEARQTAHPEGEKVFEAHYAELEPPACDVAVAIGTLVGPSDRARDERRSRDKAARLLDWMRRTRARAAILMAVDLDKIDAAPWLSDPSLDGIRTSWRACDGVHPDARIVAVSRFELALFWGGELDLEKAIVDAYSGPFAPFDAADGAWLCAEVGNVEMARDFLRRDTLRDVALAAVVEARIEGLESD